MHLACMPQLWLCCFVMILPGPKKPQPLLGQKNLHGEAKLSDGAGSRALFAPLQAKSQPRATLPLPPAHGGLSALQTNTRRCGSHPKQLPGSSWAEYKESTNHVCSYISHAFINILIIEPRNCSQVTHLVCQTSPRGFHGHRAEVGVFLGFITVLHTDV